jgi:hypothetical protein
MRFDVFRTVLTEWFPPIKRAPTEIFHMILESNVLQQSQAWRLMLVLSLWRNLAEAYQRGTWLDKEQLARDREIHGASLTSRLFGLDLTRMPNLGG